MWVKKKELLHTKVQVFSSDLNYVHFLSFEKETEQKTKLKMFL